MFGGKTCGFCLLNADYVYSEVEDSSSVSSLDLSCKTKLSKQICFLLTLITRGFQFSGQRSHLRSVVVGFSTHD